jgi:hypothetical protein
MAKSTNKAKGKSHRKRALPAALQQNMERMREGKPLKKKSKPAKKRKPAARRKRA